MFSLLRHFSKKKGFLRKKSRLAGVTWFLFFLVVVFKSQIYLWQAVLEEDVKQHKYQAKLFQNLKYWSDV